MNYKQTAAAAVAAVEKRSVGSILETVFGQYSGWRRCSGSMRQNWIQRQRIFFLFFTDG
jgi:hypothetical protein